jgi:hypothetical protein
MGHEAVIYGVIIGASYRIGDKYSELQQRNETIIRSLEEDTAWPWADRSIFALPGPHPVGTYRRQVIHFGLSIKDDPSDVSLQWIEHWLGKFENLLKQLFWSSARLCIERDFSPQRCEYYWIPTDHARQGMLDDPPHPIATWERSVQALPGEKLRGT